MFELQFAISLGPEIPAGWIPVSLSHEGKLWILDLMAAIPAATPFDAVVVHSYKNPLVFTGQTLFGELVESTYPGYGTRPISGAAVGQLPGGVQALFHSVTPWKPTGDPDGELLAGIWAEDADGILIWGAALPEPLQLSIDLLIPVSFAVII